MNVLRYQIFAPFLLAAACAIADAQTITPIGILSGYPSVNSRALAINADGSVAVGLNGVTSSTYLAVRWTATGGIEDRSCGLTSLLSAVSANGNSAVGSFNNGSYFSSGRWDAPGPCIVQMPQPATTMGARVQGMNPAGTIVVGSADYFSTFGPYSVPYKWTQAGGVSMLPLPSGLNYGYATAVSSNSQVIVGGTGAVGILSNPQATYWDSAGAHAMGNMPAGIISLATAANTDGSIIVGYGDNGGAFLYSAGPIRAFRWIGGNYENLGMLFGAPPNGAAYARAVSDDGSVVVGETTSAASLQTAFIWRADFGMVELTDFLSWLGVNLSGWSRLTECNGISTDGTAICGTGVYNNATYGFVVRGLPKVCGPLILASTPSDTFCTGDTAVLNVSALVPSHSHFQWYQRLGSFPFYFVIPVSNGGNVSGATTPTLIISSIQPSSAGDYFCRISGGCNTVDSSICNVAVHSAPVVTLNPPLDLAPCGHGPVTLTIAATSNAGPISYQWQAESPFMSNNYVNLSNGLNSGIVTASGATATSITLTDFNLAGATVYRCRLTNSCGTSYPMATLITPCFGDFNCDGSVDFFDYLDFVDSYSAAGDTADFNHDGNVDFFDYLDFVDAYSAGC